MKRPGGRRGRLLLLLPPLLVVSFYGIALDRRFTSEDFLLVRVLGERPPWRELASWTEPWLGVTVVKFYRPVSTLLYGLEVAAFGPWPLGYTLVHVLLHAANALLVFAIARRLLRTVDASGGDRAPAAIAALFALHPLHPNAVLFGASFATVWGSAFVLGSFLASLRIGDGRWRWWGVALGLFVLALGSYETAATLPLLVLAHAWLAPGAAVRRGATALPFLAVLGLYFLVRRAIFGVFVGGYDDVGARLLEPWLWVGDTAASIQTLHAPVFDQAPVPGAAMLAVALLCVGPLLVLTLTSRRMGGGFTRLWLFAWAWTLISLAPFAFRPAVPGNGRFWYLAAAGVAMATGFFAAAVVTALPRPWRPLPWIAVAAVALYWGWLLTGYLGVYRAAGRTAQTIQHELLREHAAAGAPSPIFVTGYPYFLDSRAGVPVAQVFHYGLRDAVNPPFVRGRAPVYPLPPLRGTELRAIFMAAPGAVVLEWIGSASRFRRVEPRAMLDVPVREIAVLGPEDGGTLGPRELSVQVAPGAGHDVRLIVVAQGNSTVAQSSPLADRDGIVTLALPAQFMTTMARLYRDGAFYWWAEDRDGGGRLVGVSRMRSFRLRAAGPPA